MLRVALATVLVALSLPVAGADATARGTNGRIAFHRDFYIWLVTAQGLLPTQVTDENTGGIGRHSDPACTPDGSQIAYITPVGTSNGAVAVIDANGQNLHYVSGHQHAASGPTWSPDQTRIAWSQYNGQTRQIVVSDADAVGQYTELTGVIDPNNGNYVDGISIQPDWSPDGKKIAFASDRDGDNDIYTVNVTTGTIKQITNNPGPDVDPTWAPGGGRIAFTRFVNGNSDIWVMRSDGTGQVNVTGSSPAIEHQPSWSPDGKKIAFTRGVGDDDHVFKMSTDGTSVKELAEGDSPSWCGLGL